MLAGILLLGAEIYVPGGILGTFGVLALAGAAIVGFKVDAFGEQGGMISALIIGFSLIAGLYAWMRYFPRSFFGKKLTLMSSGDTFHGENEKMAGLIGKEGTAETDLRPSGIALIDSQRIDVVADGGWIDKSTPIRVTQVKGNHVTVTDISSDRDARTV